MVKRIALQLYSVREVPQDYETKVRRVAEMGYQGVETADFPGTTAEAAAKLFKELGLTVTGAHAPMPLGSNQRKVLDTLEALGKPALVCTQIGREDVKSVNTVRQLCDRLNESYAVAQANGLAFAIHNHWWEFGEVEGRPVHGLMLELLDPGILFEIDTYWVKAAGRDPAAVVKSLGKRVPFLHIKDGPANRQDPMTAVGDGVMDIPSILHAALPDAWQIVEIDRSAGDMMTAVKRSYDYLAGLSS